MTKARDIASANPAPSTVSATELGYLDGVTSAVQTQIDTKIASTLADAKGDLLVASADNTVTRLAVGSTGETIVADSSTATGLRWQVPVNVNPVLNSAFQIWQRGTSIAFAATGSPYGPDRWNVFSGNTGTCSRQATGDTTNLPNIQYAARVQRTAAVTSTSAFEFGQAFETINSIPFVGKTVTLSFYIRKGADFSGSTLNAQILSGTGTDQNPISGSYTGQATVVSTNIASSLTTTWQRISMTGTVATSATELTVRFYWVPSGTAGAADYYEVTGVQLEVGSVVTPFKTYAGTIQGELAACQRYYWQQGGSLYQGLGPTGYSTSTTGANAFFVLPVEMRTVPTLTWANIIWRQANGTGVAASAIVITGSGLSTNKVIRLEHTLSAVTAGLWGFQEVNGTAAGYLGLSAEL